MARDRRDGPTGTEPVHKDKEQHSSPETGSEASLSRLEEEKNGEERERVSLPQDGIRFSFSTRRVRIEPRKKRENYVKRLEKVMRQCEKIVNDPAGFEDIQLRALGVLIQAIKVCYGIVLDLEVETLEKEVVELEEEKARLGGEAGRKSLGYMVEDSTI
jgi:hypothetical protein